MTHSLVLLPQDPILADLLEERGHTEAANILRGQSSDLQFFVSSGKIYMFDSGTNTGRVFVEKLNSYFFFSQHVCYNLKHTLKQGKLPSVNILYHKTERSIHIVTITPRF